MEPVVIIPARVASTRLPEKVLLPIAGEPMIVHVWRRAKAAEIGPVYVACDDARVAKAVKKAGGEAIMTRPDHPSGSDRVFEALQIIDAPKRHDVVVNVQGDVPTIDPAALRAVLTPLEEPQVDIATLAAIIHDLSECTDPAVVKPVFGRHKLEGRKGTIKRALSFSRNAPRKEPLYHHIGIYAYRREALERFVTLPPSEGERLEKLEQLRAIDAGMRIDVAIVDTVPLGVDTKEHLEKARKILGGGD